MHPKSGEKRIDSASRFIKASPRTIYQAYLNPKSLAAWLPPEGMTARIDRFEAWEGGVYRMVLTYTDSGQGSPGKSSQNSDIVEGRFLDLVPDERIVQQVEFESDDPAFAGTMTMTWNLVAVPGGTEVTILGENVPCGIKPEDHEAGMKSTLQNLADFTE